MAPRHGHGGKVGPQFVLEQPHQNTLQVGRDFDQDAINACIADESPKLRETAADGLKMVTLTKDFHIKDLEVTVRADGQTADAHLRANGTLKVNHGDMISRVFTRWQTVWKHIGTEWKLLEVKRLDPVNGQEMGILDAR